jgi:hypothetical protein
VNVVEDSSTASKEGWLETARGSRFWSSEYVLSLIESKQHISVRILEMSHSESENPTTKAGDQLPESKLSMSMRKPSNNAGAVADCSVKNHKADACKTSMRSVKANPKDANTRVHKASGSMKAHEAWSKNPSELIN